MTDFDNDDLEFLAAQARAEHFADDLRDKVERLTAINADLLEALESIAEYWNKDRNDEAMFDACWHAIDTAVSAIAKAKGEQQ